MTTTHDTLPRALMSDSGRARSKSADVPHVVVIGAGFAGLQAVRALRKAPVKVTLIDRHNFQTFQPLLYQVATAGLNVADVAFPIRGVTRRYKNCSFRRGDVASIDHDRPRRPPRGRRHDRLRLPDRRCRCPRRLLRRAGRRRSMRSRCTHSRTRRDCAITSFAASSWPTHTRSSSNVVCSTFVVVGAGPTGVEMAGALFEVCRHPPQGLPAAAATRAGDRHRDARRRAAGVPREVTAVRPEGASRAAWTSDSARRSRRWSQTDSCSWTASASRPRR